MTPSKMAPGQKSLKIEYDERSVSLNRYIENHSNTMSGLSTDECFSCILLWVAARWAGRPAGRERGANVVAAGGQGYSARGVWRVRGGGRRFGRVAACLPAGALARWPPLRNWCGRNVNKIYLRCPQRMLAAFCDYYQYRYQSQQVICVTLLH